VTRYTIWRKTFTKNAVGETKLDSSSIVGTYPGPTTDAALEAMAKDERDASFAASCTRLKLTRDNYDLIQVEE
jgi:hypothetical protein